MLDLQLMGRMMASKSAICLAVAYSVGHDLVEARLAVGRERRAHLCRGAACRVSAQDVVRHQRVDLVPILVGEGVRQCGLIELGAGELEIARMVLTAQDMRHHAAQPVARNARVVVHRAGDERRLAHQAAAAVLPAPDLVQRPADEFRRRCRADQHSVGGAPGELQHPRSGRGEPDRNCSRAHRKPAARYPQPPTRERDSLARQQRAGDRDRFPQGLQRMLGDDSCGFEVARGADPEAERHPAGKAFVERRGRHGGVHGMHRVGAHGHQHDTDAPAGGERQGRAGDRLALKEMRCDPDIGGAGLLRHIHDGAQSSGGSPPSKETPKRTAEPSRSAPPPSSRRRRAIDA